MPGYRTRTDPDGEIEGRGEGEGGLPLSLPPPPPPHDSESILSSLRRAELRIHASRGEWERVGELLNSNPEVARATDPATGALPLHDLAGAAGVPPLLVDIAILQHPAALMQRDGCGGLPLHCAARGVGGPEVLRIILASYVDGRTECDGAGRLPIHAAAEAQSVDSVRLLLGDDPDSVSVPVRRMSEGDPTFSGGLPMHCACRSSAGAPHEVIELLLSKHKDSAKTLDYRNDLPLHVLLRRESAVEAKTLKVLHLAYPSALRTKDSSGDTPLVTALKSRCNAEVVIFLVQNYRGAAAWQSGDGRSPLVLALEKNHNDEVVISLIDQAPEFVSRVDKFAGLQPIDIAMKTKRSSEVVLKLVMSDLPIDIRDKESTDIKYHDLHGHSWKCVVSSDEYLPVVVNILKKCTHAQRIALARMPCENEQAIFDRASPLCRQQLLIGLRLFGLIELTDSSPAYATAETQIYYGVKYSGTPSLEKDVKVILDQDSQSQVDNGLQVLVKLSSDRIIMERELLVRRDYCLDIAHIPPVYSLYQSVKGDLKLVGRQALAYCMTMECADCTLENKWLEVRNGEAHNIDIDDMRSIAEALRHLHSKGLVHGDMGKHNIGKFGSTWKLLSIGGAQKVGAETDPYRGYYFPPEAVVKRKRKIYSNILKIKSKTNLIPIPAATTTDTWSFGVLLFEFLCGEHFPLYAHTDRNNNFANVRKWSTSALARSLDVVRRENAAGADLLSSLLQPNPLERMSSMDSVLSHELFEGADGKDSNILTSSHTSFATKKDRKGNAPLKESLNPPTADFVQKEVPVKLLRSPVESPYPPIQQRRAKLARRRDGEKRATDDVPTFNVKQKKAPVQMLRSSEASPYPIQQMRATVATGRKDDKEEPPLWGLANSMSFNSSKEDVPVQRLRRLARSSYPIQQRRVLPPPRGDGDVARESSFGDVDCFSTASTKFADNTTAAATKQLSIRVPAQVVAAGRTQPEPGIEAAATDTSASDGHDSSCDAHDSDDSSLGPDRSSRIVPGSRIKKERSPSEAFDLQLV